MSNWISNVMELKNVKSVPTHQYKQIFANVLTFNQLQVPALTGTLVSGYFDYYVKIKHRQLYTHN